MSLHIHGEPIDLTATYPDGTPLVKLKTTALEVYAAGTWVLRPESWGELWTALAFADAVRASVPPYAWRARLVLPLVPGSRQDRHMGHSGDQLQTLRTVCTAVNARAFGSVQVFDPHSSVTPALLERCQAYDISESGRRPAWRDVVGVIAPDAGAERRASAVAAQLKVPCVQATKHRDPRTGQLSGFSCPPLPPGKHLVVDDLCDGGGTFLGLADAIRESSPQVTLDLYVSHGLFTQGVELLRTRYTTLYTTDSTVRATTLAGVQCLHLFTEH